MDKSIIVRPQSCPKTLAYCLARRLLNLPLTAGLTLMDEDKRSNIARAILEYLLEHPAAQDTLAGIAEWWLPEEKTKTRLVVVKDALDQLAAEGLVLERRGKDSQTHYRINGQRLRQIEKLAGRAKPPSSNT